MIVCVTFFNERPNVYLKADGWFWDMEGNFNLEVLQAGARVGQFANCSGVYFAVQEVDSEGFSYSPREEG